VLGYGRATSFSQLSNGYIKNNTHTLFEDEDDAEYEDDIVDLRHLLPYTGLNLAVKCLRNGGASTISKPRSSFFRSLISKIASTR